MHYHNYLRMSLFLFICTALIYSLVPAPVAAEEAVKEIPHESGLYYTIQKGDTLWDLSKRFFDSPDLWPDLWNKNSEIANPHRIYPGERIRVHREAGTEKIKEPEKIVEEVKKEKVVIPPPPPPPEPPAYFYSPIESVGFIRKEPVKPSGTIFRSREDKTMISAGDEVYVRPAKHTILYKGAKFIVYRIFEGVRSKKYTELSASYGAQHYFTGIAEIIQSEGDYYIARITRSFRSIKVNDLLMPHLPRSPKIILTESKEGISGQVITNEDRDRMFGDKMVAFIDKGKKDGIEVGQFYSVYYEDQHGLKFYKGGDQRRSAEKKEAVHTPIDFAKVLVLHTEENTSTVLVTYSEKDIYPTAKIRTPVK